MSESDSDASVESSIQSEESDDDESMPRIKEANPDLWKKRVAKQRRVAGQEYVNSAGKVVPEKEIGQNCTYVEFFSKNFSNFLDQN